MLRYSHQLSGSLFWSICGGRLDSEWTDIWLSHSLCNNDLARIRANRPNRRVSSRCYYYLRVFSAINNQLARNLSELKLLLIFLLNMGQLNKRQRHLRKLREAQRQRLEERILQETLEITSPELHEAHWEGLSDSDSESEVEISEPEDNIPVGDIDAFETLMRRVEDSAHETKFLYQRGSVLSDRQQYRHLAAKRDLANAARAHSQPISRFFSSPAAAPPAPMCLASEPQPRLEAIKDLEKKLHSKKEVLEGQNLTRHRAVLALLYTMELRQDGETREELSFQVARSFNKGVYFARKIVEWERMWLRERRIQEGKRGCYAKTFSWANDEGVQIAVREWCAGQGDSKFLTY